MGFDTIEINLVLILGIKKYPRGIFSVEIPLTERDSKRFRGGETENLFKGQTVRKVGIEHLKDR